MYEKAMFAENLKKIISQRGTTQREIAEKLGVTETTISRYVTTGPKGRTPNVESLVALAQVLNVSLDTLVGVEPPATARQAPDVKILVSAYEKAALEQREAIWSMMNAFMLLTPEQKVIIEALVEQRERQEQAMGQTEQLLRRMTGSITEYVNTVGMRPLRMSDFDKAVLAIQDGELEAFKKYAAKVPYQQEETLLVEAAGRPGAVGRKMTELLMRDRCNIDYAAYCNACKRAIDINDPEKVLSMMVRAQASVPQLEPSFFGEMASYAHSDHRFIAKEIIKRCGEEQIAAAPSFLLEQFAMDKDFRTLSALVEKGISGGGSSARTLHMLTYEGRDSWIAEELLEKRMWVDVNDYSALHACVQNDAVEVCRLLLDGGMDFDQYRQWAQTRPCAGHEETLQALADHWSEMQAEVEQAPAQENGGMTLG